MENTTDKINLDEIVKLYKVTNDTIFISYLKELWLDFSQRNDSNTKGISKLTFASYYNLPGILMDRLFSVIDTNKSDFLEAVEFTVGMTTLFCGDFDASSKFIFDFYDFDKDGRITKEDIRTVLSYISLSKEMNNYQARVNSQEELFDIIEKCFSNLQGNTLNYHQFKGIIENVSSDIYLMILLFLYEKRPFTNALLSCYEKQKVPNGSPEKKLLNSPSKLLASPTKTCSFSPYLMFNRPQKRKTTMTNDITGINHRILQTSIKRNQMKHHTLQNNPDDIVHLMPIIKESKLISPKKSPKKLPYMISQSKENKDIVEAEAEGILSPVPMKRKIKKDLKEIGNKEILSLNKPNNEIIIQPAFKQINPPIGNYPKKGSSETASITSFNNAFEDTDNTMEHNQHCFEGNNEHIVHEEISDEDDKEDEVNLLTYAGYLYKHVNDKVKKVWFKLIHKDLFYFKTDKDNLHKGMHNLSGIFIQEEKPKTLQGKNFFCFSLIFPKKIRYYYIENEIEYRNWIDHLKKATEYTNLTDIYQICEELGRGKFGLIKLGINKSNGRKVAIKIMSKKNMSTSDLELVRTEIEILKICQHPNIIELYEVFENIDYFYIIMEYCSGGDLFEYLEKRKFKLTEPHACRLMHKMFTAIYYIHSYGVAHRDLKPENVLMTSKDDDADIRILDFGLSKIIGPNEKCSEPYGTLSYVAPEVLLDEPYHKEVDLWSLGVITYLLLSGSLPFDHKTSEEEIARKTVTEPPPYKGSIWKRISPEAKTFVNGLLIKKPADRMTIKGALEHEWFHMFCGNDLTQLRRKSKEYTSKTFELYSSSKVKDINDFADFQL